MEENKINGAQDTELYFIKLTIDLAFKYIFGELKNIELLKSLLTDITKLPIEELEDLGFMGEELHRDSLTDRKTIVDVRAKLKDKRQIAIEMQVQNYQDMGKRSLWEWAKMYGSQLGKSEKFKDLAKCICINITAFDYTGKKSGYSRSVIKDADTNETYKGMDDLEIFFIELPKRDTVGDDRLQKWMTLLSSKSWEEMERNAKGDEIMTQVYEQAREIAQNESMRIAIHNREKFLIGQNSLKEEGREEGYLEAQKEFESERKDYEDEISKLKAEIARLKKN